MDGRGLWTRGWSSSGGKETEDWNQLSLIMCYLISADVYLTLVYCVFVVIYLGSRNGDWTLICTPRKMIINTECTGEIFILWKKQVRNEWKSHSHFTILMTPLSCLSDQLMSLISAAKEHCVEFIYAISPGLDITFSNPKEVAALKRKLSQVCVWHQSDWGEELSRCDFISVTCVFFEGRLVSLAVARSRCCLTTLKQKCVGQIKKLSAHSLMLKCPSPMKCFSTWRSRRSSSSVPQVCWHIRPSIGTRLCTPQRQ